MKLELLTYEKENLPRGWKPYYIYLIMVDHIEVGRIVLREGSNEERYYDGHIGYTIEKEYRGHHYSKDACLLLFDKAKEKGFKQLMITCSPDNIASRKIIESLPFKYLETKEVPACLKKDFDQGDYIKEYIVWIWRSYEIYIHLADLHLGKIIYQNNLLDIQIDLLNQVMNYMVQKNRYFSNCWEMFMIVRLLLKKV